MQFLKTLFWVVVAIVVVLFAKANWYSVSIKLWGGLEADVKMPLILFIGFAIGFLPTFIIHHARLWSLRRQIEPLQRNVAVQSVHSSAAAAAAAAANAAEPPAAERTATDSKAWPAS
jgi:putative membrane protein